MRQNEAERRLNSVRARITQACRATGRDPEDVQLLAVSKTQPPEKIRALFQAGQAAFGENYVADALEKQPQLSDLPIRWHYIGPVQSNKTRDIAGAFDWVESVDRDKILRRLDEQRPDDRPPLNICLQVNLDGEEQKAGCRPEALPELAREAAGCRRLKLRGIMAIPAPREDTAGQLAVFRRLRELYDTLRADHPDLDTLSAGMSADLEAAVRAGSTQVRVGTALFGPRNTEET